MLSSLLQQCPPATGIQASVACSPLCRYTIARVLMDGDSELCMQPSTSTAETVPIRACVTPGRPSSLLEQALLQVGQRRRARTRAGAWSRRRSHARAGTHQAAQPGRTLRTPPRPSMQLWLPPPENKGEMSACPTDTSLLPTAAWQLIGPQRIACNEEKVSFMSTT